MSRWFPVPLTARHLAHGDPWNCYSCPVALALEEATGQGWYVTDDTARMELLHGWSWRPPGGHIWRFPPWVRALIRRIDRREPVTPCMLRLPRRFVPFFIQESTGRDAG
jgi:hypothetical protein